MVTAIEPNAMDYYGHPVYVPKSGTFLVRVPETVYHTAMMLQMLIGRRIGTWTLCEVSCSYFSPGIAEVKLRWEEIGTGQWIEGCCDSRYLVFPEMLGYEVKVIQDLLEDAITISGRE